MTDYNASRRFIKARLPRLVGNLPGRSKQIQGLFVHSTRGGTKNNDDGPGTEAWANHPQNPGGFWDMLFYGTGQQVKSTYWERDEEPRWCAGGGGPGSNTWSAQDNFIHCEISHGTIDSDFTPESIESFAQFTAEQSLIYKFPVKRIEFLTQKGPRPWGIADHQNSANGVYYGKSDVGPMFPWKSYLARVNEILKGEEGVTKEEVEAMIAASEARMAEKIDRLNDAMVTRMGIQATSLPKDMALVEQAANALRKAGFEI